MYNLALSLQLIDGFHSVDDLLKDELKNLISFWHKVAYIYASEESYIYEWQNDMDTRRLLDEAIAKLNSDEKTEMKRLMMPLDIKLNENTIEINECIWGKKNESKFNYNCIANWYYYRVNQKIFEAESGHFTKKNSLKTDWQALSTKLGVLQYTGSEGYEGINSSQALEAILGDEWLRDTLNTFIEGNPGNELAIKTLRFIYSPRAAAMAYSIYDENKDTDPQKANIAVWALSDIRTKDSLDYVEEIIKKPEYETAAFSVLRNLIFDHLQWFDGQRILNILNTISGTLKEDADGLKNFIKLESTRLLPNLSNDFSVNQVEFLQGTIEYVGGINAYSIILPIQKFVFDNKIVETELRIDRILLPNALESYIGQKITFPINPNEGYIDASIYLREAHNPIDITEIGFISFAGNSIILKLTMNFIFEHEGLGFKNEKFTKEVKMIIKV
jgi:hypothetical protein